ncbi:ankyrin repeat-containing domain protein [Neocallimastix lanati (nom. inval.)]|nr:ankyrin repeat-containing domain protein [Neocallimastix sp. JGI-2020a]
MDSFIPKNKEELKRELYSEIIKHDYQKVKSILGCAMDNEIILELNEKNEDGRYPFLEAISHDNIEIVKLLIDYANKNKIILELNEKNEDGRYPLFVATSHNNIEVVKLLIDYANKNKIILELNEKNEDGRYPLLEATSHDNIEMAKLLLEYANENKIILELNEKNKLGYTPIFETMFHNNIELFKLLVKYFKKNGIKLIIDENDIEKVISNSLCNLKNISEINSKFLKLIYFFKNKNIIEVIFSKNSYFLKKINEINENKRIGDESMDYEELESESEIMDPELKTRKNEKEKIEKKRENKKLEGKRDENNIEEVKNLIRFAMNINMKNKDGDNPLLIGSKNRNMEFVKCLLKYKEHSFSIKTLCCSYINTSSRIMAFKYNITDVLYNGISGILFFTKRRRNQRRISIPIHFISRRLMKAEKNYGILDWKELFALLIQLIHTAYNYGKYELIRYLIINNNMS